jgi:aminopeptidase N
MKMLEAEIGPQKVMNALGLIARERKGQDTRWRDLRPYFERAGGKPLQWFWQQWIENATFPTLDVLGVDPIQREKTYRTYVKVRQSGTAHPFRLRFALVFRVKGEKIEKQFSLESTSDDFSFDSDSIPEDVQLKVFPYTLARVHQYKPVQKS